MNGLLQRYMENDNIVKKIIALKLAESGGDCSAAND